MRVSTTTMKASKFLMTIRQIKMLNKISWKINLIKMTIKVKITITIKVKDKI